MRKIFVIIFAGFAFCAGQRSCHGQSDKTDLRNQLWIRTANLIQRREYALAANRLENSLDDSEMFPFTSSIQKDLDAVRLLRRLSNTVEYSASKLVANQPLNVLSAEYRFVRLKNGSIGKAILLTNPAGREVTYPLKRLDSATWLQIADAEIQQWPERDFAVGLFLAFDRYPDTRKSRMKFDAVADTGQDVAIWVQRLEAARKLRQNPKSADNNEKTTAELLLGKWSIALKRGPRLTFEFKRGGKATIVAPRGRVSAKWTQESTGTFRLTGQRGKTFVIQLAGDRMSGTGTKGIAFRGVRQAK